MKSLALAAGFICLGIVLAAVRQPVTARPERWSSPDRAITPNSRPRSAEGHDPTKKLQTRTILAPHSQECLRDTRRLEAQTRSAQDGTRDIQNNALRTRAAPDAALS